MSSTRHNVGEQHLLGPDIYQELFRDVFAGEIFQQWSGMETSTWQLRVVGGPGSGKTKLAAVMADRLRKRFIGGKDVVACVFVPLDVQWDESVFETILLSVLHQLRAPFQGQHEAPESNTTYHARALKEIKHQEDRTEFLCQELELCIQDLDHAFLIVDGEDRCGWFSNLRLQDIFPELQSAGLKIMTTARTLNCTKYERENMYKICDGCGNGGTKVYWRCQSGAHEDVYDVCVECHEKKQGLCAICGKSSLAQPYSFRVVDLNQAISPTIMQEYVGYDLETEHGDIGLQSTCPQKPPLSKLGHSLAKSATGKDIVEKLRFRIYDFADGNISLARLALDVVHRKIDTIDNRPLSSVAELVGDDLFDLFEAIFGEIAKDGGIGVLALTVTLAVFSNHPRKCSVDRLVGTLEWIGGEVVEFDGVSDYSINKILHDSHGLLFIVELSDGGVCGLVSSLREYVENGDCEEVVKQCNDLYEALGLSFHMEEGPGRLSRYQRFDLQREAIREKLICEGLLD